jgi:hypothetical protein
MLLGQNARKWFFAVFGGMEGSWKGLIPFKLWVEALMNPQKQLNVATCCRCVAGRKGQRNPCKIRIVAVLPIFRTSIYQYDLSGDF